MSVQPAVAANVTTYASHTPYLTLLEWQAAPTAIDTSDLVLGGSPTQEAQVVTDVIERASSMLDELCYQVLAATKDTHSGRYLVNQWGVVKVPLPRKPILEVSAVSVGSRQSGMAPLTSLADVYISPHGVIEVPVQNVLLPYASFGSGTRPIVQVTYVNGFPNTTLTAPFIATATNITVASSLGIYPGTALTIYDTTGGNDMVTVAPSFVAGSLTVPLVAPLGFAHAAGVSVSNLPPKVKQATILLTSELIAVRGNEAIVLDSIAAAMTASATRKGSAANLDLAASIIQSLRRSA